MRVLMISSNLDKGGIGSVVMTLYRSLQVRGIHCDLTYYEGSEPKQVLLDEIARNGTKLWKLQNIKSIGLIGYIKQIRSICMHGNYDVIHIHTSLFIWLAGIGARLGGVKTIVGHAHGARFLNYSGLALSLIEPIGRLLNRLICNGFVSCTAISARYTFGREAVFLPNYVPYDSLQEISEQEIREIRHCLGFEDDAIVFGFMGCLDGVKKADFIVQVIEQLRKMGMNACAFLAGNTERKEFFENLLQEKGLQKQVKLLGFVVDCDRLMHAVDYYISASESEGMSVSFVQAQMTGKPCIISSLLPPENDLGIGLALKIDGYDPCAWAKAIIQAIHEGLIPRENKCALLQIAERGLDEKKSIDRLLSVYKREPHMPDSDTI